MIDYLINFIIGLSIGIIAGLFGIGGGFLIVPLLTLKGLPIHDAIGTSLTCIVMSSFASSYTHLKHGRVLFKVAALKEAFSIPTALLGAYLTIFLGKNILKSLFAFLLIYLSYTMLTSREQLPQSEAKEINYRNVPLVGIIAGLSSGLLGISGGILNVPLFNSLVQIPISYAIGTSSVALFFTALAGSLMHYHIGQVRVDVAILLAPGLIMGGYLGAKLVHNIHPEKLKRAFAAILVLIALKMVL
ncbi:sulfite exporter TauE/SafE family protein [Thermococci archaeon]|nr:MAG: sulfite exporter TauE/SafE family protein [Thermococci archaeon]